MSSRKWNERYHLNPCLYLDFGSFWYLSFSLNVVNIFLGGLFVVKSLHRNKIAWLISFQLGRLLAIGYKWIIYRLLIKLSVSFVPFHNNQERLDSNSICNALQITSRWLFQTSKRQKQSWTVTTAQFQTAKKLTHKSVDKIKLEIGQHKRFFLCRQ